ncbi:MAG: hypothetical protein DMG04_26865 [Acidobacteria bacterium]|nr:MAG: hypothetical protein DMG04_26865 [Acidobacteriota bacterium]PYQ86399.1 MAG: hypothetical protein DMG02_25320 [Acidobacteriota bacterium]PYQ88946.1 MAG: hypothetical protein DMG03_02735 [Acidobacteriota bacterium]PYR05541.1 MAG: hypothetical protein DMF99_28155 [Acidobacteriota bacterium]
MHRGRRPPVLPEAARQASIRGIVIVEITIGIDGGITDAHVVRSIPLLDAAALQCARQWRYQPVSMIERPPRRLERAAAAARPRAGNPRSGAPFDRPNNTRRQQRHFNGLPTYAAAGLRPRLEAGVVCCGRSWVDGRLKVRQIEGGLHARTTSPSTATSATPSVVERRRVARLRAVGRHTIGHNTRRQPPHATAIAVAYVRTR